MIKKNHDFMHTFSPRAGKDNPDGEKNMRVTESLY